MFKLNVLYASIAARHRTSAAYVQQIHLGLRPANSKLAQIIKADLARRMAKLEKVAKEVLA